MRFAAIADIHGNSAALRAVLADIAAQGVTDIVNLGDVVSGPLAARETLAMLRPLQLPTVRGNHDRYLLDRPVDRMGSWERDIHGELLPDDLAWLAALPPTLVWRDEVFLCHATPSSDERYWLETVRDDGTVALAPLAQVEQFAAGVTQPLLLCGHSHLPRLVRLPDGRHLVNPGSVGSPAYRDIAPVSHVVQTGTPHASYAVLERRGADWQVSFRQVPYDAAPMIALAEARGRVDWVAALRSGWLA
jgi:predicted phosphodiesterase